MNDTNLSNNRNEGICTKYFRMSIVTFLALLYVNLKKWFVILLGVIFISFLGLGIIWDFRWIILAFMVVLIIIPACMAYLYYIIATKPGIFFNSIYHRLIFYPSTLEVWCPEDSEDKCKLLKVFQYRDTPHIIVRKEGILMDFREEEILVWLPYSALSNTEDLRSIMTYVKYTSLQ